MPVRALCATLRRAVDSNRLDALLLEMLCEHLHLGVLVAEYKHLGELPGPREAVLGPDLAHALLDVRELVPARVPDVLGLERLGKVVQLGRGKARVLGVVDVQVVAQRAWDGRAGEDEVERVRDGFGLRQLGLVIELVGEVRYGAAARGGDFG